MGHNRKSILRPNLRPSRQSKQKESSIIQCALGVGFRSDPLSDFRSDPLSRSATPYPPGSGLGCVFLCVWALTLANPNPGQSLFSPSDKTEGLKMHWAQLF